MGHARFRGFVVAVSYLLHEWMVFRRLSLVFALTLTWDAWTWVKEGVPPTMMNSVMVLGVMAAINSLLAAIIAFQAKWGYSDKAGQSNGD